MKSKVYFVGVAENDTLLEAKIARIYSAAGFDAFVSQGETVAIKTHFGEKGNNTHISARHIRQIVDRVKAAGGRPYLTETSVLYRGRRSNALDHILLAFEHGFTYTAVGAPILMADGFLGNWQREVEINGEFYQSVPVAGDALVPDKLFVVSHATGHMITGMGAALKNLGMGLSSRKGKLNQHSQLSPKVKPQFCTNCGECYQWCPADAIEERDQQAFIVVEKCIGCGECLTVCHFEAIAVAWDASSEVLQKKMVEHALGVFKSKEGRIAFLTFLTSMTRDCDCVASSEKCIGDIGIVASFDPVALDMAALDITARRADGQTLAKLSYPQRDPMVQLAHASKLGMGSIDYDLVEVP